MDVPDSRSTPGREPAARARAVFREAFADRDDLAPEGSTDDGPALAPDDSTSDDPTLVAVAPGRVNLVGGHTDYEAGFVLPAAVDRHVAVATAPRGDRMVRVRSVALDDQGSFSLDAPLAGDGPDWLDYVRGVASKLAARGIDLRGADLAVANTLPMGAGLGSSAAFEVAAGRALAAVAGATVGARDLAAACRAAEREVVGVDCGVMDQLAAALGRRDHALLVDCHSFAVDPRRLDPARARVVVVDTTVRHDLVESAYNDRVATCREAVRRLDAALDRDVAALRDVSSADLDRHGDELPATVRLRARHVVTENRRVQAAAAALADGDLDRVGDLMDRSHASLRDRYEVSCVELDAIVDLARETRGVYGARMTGAGFGGCAVALVAPDAVGRFRERISRGFPERTGREADVYVCRPVDGCHVV